MGKYLKILNSQLQSTYPEFENDVRREISKKDAALKMIELRLSSGQNMRTKLRSYRLDCLS